MLVLATLGAPERRRLPSRRRSRQAPPGPPPTPVATGRATVIDAGAPLASVEQARAWLTGAGEPELSDGLLVLNRALHAFRLATADPYLQPVGRWQTLVARLGFGAGEEVADGHWTAARELPSAAPRQRRSRVLEPQARLAAVLGGRADALACEELTLRARLDLDHGRRREAALQASAALEAALAELPRDPAAAALAQRLEELRARHGAVADAARAALAGPLGEAQAQAVTGAVARLEAALRARAVAAQR